MHSVTKMKKKLCRRLERHLKKHKKTLFTKQHRDKNKLKLSLRGSFKVGNASCQPGHIQFVNKIPYFIKHNFKNTGVWIKPVKVQRADDRKFTKEMHTAYKLALKIMKLVDPDYVKGEHVVNFSFMNRRKHYVKKHVDDMDISHQYALGLGEYEGAELRVWNKDQSNFQDFDYRHKMLKMDGRNYHELITNNFEGERFTVIWYKHYDHRMTQADPILDTPEVVWSF